MMSIESPSKEKKTKLKSICQFGSYYATYIQNTHTYTPTHARQTYNAHPCSTGVKKKFLMLNLLIIKFYISYLNK